MRNTYRAPVKIQSIDLQELGAELKIFGELQDDTYRHFNPAIAWHGGKLKIAVRSCNFTVERHGKWSLRDGSAYSRTDVLLGELDPNTLQVGNLSKLELSKDSPTRTLVHGLEDVRLFSRKDGLHALGFESDRLSKHLHNASTSLAEYIIKGSKLVYLRSLDKPDRKVVEKNWMPADVPTKFFDFTYSDTQTYKDGELTGEPSKTQIHGGSQLLKQKDGTYLSLVHEKKLDPTVSRLYSRHNTLVYDKYTYFTYLAQHGKDGIITKLSKPFRFGTLENIEFASGMVEHDGKLLITLGIRDCKWAVVSVDKPKLMGLFEEKSEYNKERV